MQVELFKNLKTLSCNGNYLTSLDVSRNTILKGLHCYMNNLTSLDVSNNLELVELRCGLQPEKRMNVEELTELLNTMGSLDYVDFVAPMTLTIDRSQESFWATRADYYYNTSVVVVIN